MQSIVVTVTIKCRLHHLHQYPTSYHPLPPIPSLFDDTSWIGSDTALLEIASDRQSRFVTRVASSTFYFLALFPIPPLLEILQNSNYCKLATAVFGDWSSNKAPTIGLHSSARAEALLRHVLARVGIFNSRRYCSSCTFDLQHNSHIQRTNVIRQRKALSMPSWRLHFPHPLVPCRLFTE
jgi:hypothetical protein